MIGDVASVRVGWSKVSVISALARYVEQILDRISANYADLRDALSPPVQLIIDEDAGASQQRGLTQIGTSQSRREIHARVKLNPTHFLILTLPLPLGAKPYLNAVIASQIDRISPWPAERAIFGFAILSENSSGLSVRVAIAARDDIARLLTALDCKGYRSITLDLVTDGEGVSAPISIGFESQSRLQKQSDRRMISALTFGTLALVILTEAARIGFGNVIERELSATRKEIAALRETIAGASAGRDLKSDPLARMINLKSTLIPNAEVIDVFSKILPDNTYLTAMDIEPGKLHIEGVSTVVTDLPKAISGQSIFGDATFSAPTAKRRDGVGETFQLDITIKSRQENEP